MHYINFNHLSLHVLSKRYREEWEMSLGLDHPQRWENPYLRLLAGEMTYVGGDRMNPGIRIFPLPSSNGLLGGRMSV